MTHPYPTDAVQQCEAAMSLFRAWAADPDALVLDTETTGLKKAIERDSGTFDQCPAVGLPFGTGLRLWQHQGH
jgi:hypothetical protein